MTCSQLSRITSAAALLSRSNSAASPPVTFSAAINASTTSSAVVADFEPGQPDAARRSTSRSTQHVRPAAIAMRRLPDAAGPDDLDEPRGWRPGRHSAPAPTRVRPARPTSTAGSRPTRRRSAARRAIGDAERRVVDQDPLLELLQLRSRVEAELVGQLVPNALVRRERIGLAPGPVQRGDQQLPQAFLERVRRHGRFQLADHVADVAEPQPRRELGLDELHPCLDEPRPVRGDPLAVAGALAGPPRGTSAVSTRSGRRRRGRRPHRADGTRWPHRAAPRARRPRTGRPRACSRHRR